MAPEKPSARNAAARRAAIVQVVGGVIAATGGILMAIGTTSIALFIFYFVIFAAGLGTLAYGRKVYTDSLKG